MAEISPSNESLSHQDHTVVITSLPNISPTEKKAAALHDLGNIINNISASCLDQPELKQFEVSQIIRRFKYYREHIIKNSDKDNHYIDEMVQDIAPIYASLQDKNNKDKDKDKDEDNKDEDNKDEFKQIFSKNIQLLGDQLQELPDFIDPSCYSVKKEDTNLNDFIPQFFNEISQAFPDREQHLRLINSDANIDCSLDPVLTRKTLENFIYNSAKYSPPNSNIFVFYSEDDHHIKISVKDFGIGFSPKELDSLQNLKPGKEARLSPDEASGTGFGLYNAIFYALKQGAYVEVSSAGKDIGLGSTFSLVFPK